MNSIRGTFLCFVMSTWAITLAFPSSTVSSVSDRKEKVITESQSLTNKCEVYIRQLVRELTTAELNELESWTMPALPNYSEDSSLPSVVSKTKFLRRTEFNLTLLYKAGEKLSRRRVLRIAQFDAVISDAKNLEREICRLRTSIAASFSSVDTLLDLEHQLADSDLHDVAYRELQEKVFPTDRKGTNKLELVILTQLKNQMYSLVRSLLANP